MHVRVECKKSEKCVMTKKVCRLHAALVGVGSRYTNRHVSDPALIRTMENMKNK